MYCWQSTWYCIYICKHSVSTNSILCKAAVYCNHSQWMLYQQSCIHTMLYQQSCTYTQCCTSSPVHTHNDVPAVLYIHTMLYQQSYTYTQCNGTANCTVGHHCEALLLLGQNAVNDNCVEKKTTFPISCATRNTD